MFAASVILFFPHSFCFTVSVPVCLSFYLPVIFYRSMDSNVTTLIQTKIYSYFLDGLPRRFVQTVTQVMKSTAFAYPQTFPLNTTIRLTFVVLFNKLVLNLVHVLTRTINCSNIRDTPTFNLAPLSGQNLNLVHHVYC